MPWFDSAAFAALFTAASRPPTWMRTAVLAVVPRPQTTTTLMEAAAAAPAGPAAAYTSAMPRRRRTRQTKNDNNTPEETLAELLVQLTLSIGLAVVCGLIAQYIMRSINNSLLEDETHNKDQPPPNQITARVQAILQKRAAAAAAAAAAAEDNEDNDTNKNNKKKKRIPRVRVPPLTSYEMQMASNLLDPDDIESSFANIGGLDKTKEELYSLAILPLLEPQLFAGSALVQPCKGVLLYGPPGTGKTLIAKALAKESAAVFLPLPLSAILNKWVGESNKLVAATFSLAHKLEPAIIFIDELDTFLKANSHETAHLDTIKSEFLTWWDGISTSAASQVLVLGATNRPQHIDSAILRRMPRTFLVPLPDEAGRLAILDLLTNKENVTVEARNFLPELAKQTAGYSGSDLKELCKTAAMVRIQERTHEFSAARTRAGLAKDDAKAAARALMEARKTPLRPISVKDLQIGRQKVRKTGQAAVEYGQGAARESFASRRSVPQPPQISMQDLAVLLRQFSDLSMREENAVQKAKDNAVSDEGNDEDDEIPEMTE